MLFREEKRLRRKEEALLRELRIFLRDIWAKINRESKFFMFRSVFTFNINLDKNLLINHAIKFRCATVSSKQFFYVTNEKIFFFFLGSR